MTVSRKNDLAGLLHIEPDANAIGIQPLPHPYVGTDLMPDLTKFLPPVQAGGGCGSRGRTH